MYLLKKLYIPSAFRRTGTGKQTDGCNNTYILKVKNDAPIVGLTVCGKSFPT